MIRYALQIGTQNLLQFEYESGARRLVEIGPHGTYAENMTGPQLRFMENAVKVTTRDAHIFTRHYHWFLDKDNPDESIMRYIRQEQAAKHGYVDFEEVEAW